MTASKPKLRGLSACLLGLVAVCIPLTLESAPANAQSFFQSLFGIFTPQASKAPRAAKPQEKPKSIPWVGSKEDLSEIRRSRRPKTAIPHGGAYRTMCVRSCDGYYFPISQGVPSSRFRKDELTCASRCGSGARLFYLPKNSGDIASMRDLQGTAYEDTKSAFAYRKKLRDGCTCRPMPWSAAERARHKRYEIYEAYMKIQAKREAEAERQAEAKIAALAEQRRQAAARKASSEANDPALGEADASHQEHHLSTDNAKMASQPAAAAVQGSVAQWEQPPDETYAAESQPPLAKKRAKTYRTKGLRYTKPRRRKYSSKKHQKPMGLGGMFGSGGSQKYAWPGDR
ncbi:MAG: DUF2865 domain-containing protein [Pseudomonadota bacterium]